MTARSMGGVPSPCVDICRIGAATGWCEGCMRTIDEITVWSRLDDGAKSAVWAQLAERRVIWARRVAGDGASEGAGGSGGDELMQRVTFWLDFISPYAHLAFERLPQALQGCSYEVDYRPVLFAGLLQHHAHKGPAEIEPKRAWTFRQVHWLAAQHGIAMDTPLRHPFNPLPLLRLALACGPNRRVVETIFHHVWQGGADAADPRRVAALQATLAPALDPAGAEVKAALKANTDEAIARGVFGVPSFGLGGRVFWGLDALPMLAGALQGDAWFDGPAWDREGAPRAGVVRR